MIISIRRTLNMQRYFKYETLNEKTQTKCKTLNKTIRKKNDIVDYNTHISTKK